MADKITFQPTISPRIRSTAVFVVISLFLLGVVAGGVYLAKVRSTQLLTEHQPSPHTVTQPSLSPSSPRIAPAKPPVAPHVSTTPPPAQTPSTPSPRTVASAGPNDRTTFIDMGMLSTLVLVGVFYVRSRRLGTSRL